MGVGAALLAYHLAIMAIGAKLGATMFCGVPL